MDSRQAGLSYVEVLLATALLALALVPALENLRGGIQGATVEAGYTDEHRHLATRLEAVLAEPFSDLDAAGQTAGSATVPTSYSDADADVFIARYDGDDADADGNPFTGGEATLLWIRVAGRAAPPDLQTLTSQ